MKPVPHPAKAHLVMRGIHQVDVARQLGKSPHWIGRCLNGQVPVPESLRIGVAAILGLPPEACFYDDERHRMAS